MLNKKKKKKRIFNVRCDITPKMRDFKKLQINNISTRSEEHTSELQSRP